MRQIIPLMVSKLNPLKTYRRTRYRPENGMDGMEQTSEVCPLFFVHNHAQPNVVHWYPHVHVRLKADLKAWLKMRQMMGSQTALMPPLMPTTM